MFWGKSKKALSTPRAVPDPKRVGDAELIGRPVISLSFNDISEIEPGYDGSLIGRLASGGHVLAANESLRSRVSIDVSPGDKFTLETEIFAETDATNGEPLVYSTGLLIYDAHGEVVQWWTPKPAVTRADGTQIVRESISVPSGAVSARIGVCGPWSPNGGASNGRVGVRSCAARPART